MRRLKKAWELSGREPAVLDALGDETPPGIVEHIGREKAEFLADMTPEDLVEYQRSQRGWKDWIKEHLPS